MFTLNKRFPLFRRGVIALFIIPLMFTGGSFFGELAQSQTVGQVGSIDIPQQEFVYRFQSGVEEYRRATGSDEVPPAIAERISLRVQNDLLTYYLMQAAVESKGVHAPDAAVAEEIRQTPDFHDENGEFSPDLYRQFVTDRRFYQEYVRESIGREPVFRAMAALPQDFVQTKLAAFRRQQRVVDQAVFSLDDLGIPTNISEDDINLYYQRNNRAYRVSEQADFEYFIFSLDEFAASVTVDEGDIQAAYDDFAAERERSGRRRVSHIYVEDAGLADEIAAQAIASPADFPSLVEQHSEDPFSAAAGGELGIFADGDLPPELNEVAFSMDPGEISEPVETDQGGFSILRVDEVITDGVPPLAEIRSEMAQRARRIAAQDDYDAEVEQLRDRAPLELGDLQALADGVGETIETRLTVYSAAAANDPPFDNEVVLSDAFDELIIDQGENSAPIPLDDGSYIFVRSTRYQPFGLQPLAEVRDDIAAVLRANYLAARLEQRQAQANEDADGIEAAALNALLEKAEWVSTHTLAISDQDTPEEEGNIGFDTTAEEEAGVDAIAVDRIFSVDLAYGLPTYAFIPREDEIQIYRIREIEDRTPQPDDYEHIGNLLENTNAEITANGYLDELVEQYDYSFHNVPPVLAVQ